MVPKTRRQVNERVNKLLRKKAALAKGKQPERDAKYLAFVRLWPCCICYQPSWKFWMQYQAVHGKDWHPRFAWERGTTQACHMGPHGISQKASDYTAIPMCASHHDEIGSVIKKLEAKGIDYKALVTNLREAYEAQK